MSVRYNLDGSHMTNVETACSRHRAGFHVRTVEEQQDLKRLLQQAGCLEKLTRHATCKAVAPIRQARNIAEAAGVVTRRQMA